MTRNDNYWIGTEAVLRVALKLTQMHFVVAFTSRNAAGVDLMVTAPDTGRTYGVQVKGSSKGRNWTLKKANFQLRDPRVVYVFVNLRVPSNPEFYVRRGLALHSTLQRGYWANPGNTQVHWPTLFRGGLVGRDEWSKVFRK